ncbi:peptidoglycan/LPS O-acetylase OafA/YrhL [Bacillus niacini]|uniref:Peptidoglycan/LPS O-acetylase OafA/YrhL n=1 Tax=Neobacillus niacini TaxID=86668 RepID=A0A852T7Q4_9BACI|nr:acyltransferase [Neobacillus niacini]NYE03866.1 peptidoglycan/LPS O-acetylase OafA/YrhL [Neobacillus niacini]
MLKPLTSFRFFAALAVFFSHLSYFKEYNYLEWLYVHIFYEGSMGVSFFFILSGFILTYNYHDKFNPLNKYNTSKFLISRFARIYPVHILTFILSLPLLYKAFLESTLITLAKAIPNLMLLHSFFPIREVYFSFNGVSWSLSNEIFFYLCMPIIIYFYNKFNLNGLKPLIYIVILLLVATTFAIGFSDSLIKGWLLYIFPLFRMIEFIIGTLIAILFIKQPINWNKYQKYFTLFEISSLLSLLIGMYINNFVPTTFHYGLYYIPFMSLIIYIFAYQMGRISKLISNRLFIYLGEISFSFYMLHQLVIRYSSYIPGIKSSPIILAIFSFIISLFGSVIIYSLYEVPLRNKIKNWYYVIFPKKRIIEHRKVAR